MIINSGDGVEAVSTISSPPISRKIKKMKNTNLENTTLDLTCPKAANITADPLVGSFSLAW